MRKICLILCLMLAATWGHAQGSVFNDVAWTRDGKPIPGATVRVCEKSAADGSSCTPLATIYSDETLATAAANPFTTDAVGNLAIYARPGIYKVCITAGNTTACRKQNIAATEGADVSFRVVNGVRYADRFATAGAGTDASPWTGWESVLTGLDGKRIFFPSGVYSTATALNLCGRFIVEGAVPSNSHTGGGSIIRLTAAGAGLFINGTDCSSTTEKYVLRNLTVDGAATANYGITFGKATGSPKSAVGLVESVVVTRTQLAGYRFIFGFNTLVNASARSNNGDGFLFDDSGGSSANTATKFLGGRALLNAGVGLHIKGLHGGYFYGFVSESNGLEGVKLANTSNSVARVKFYNPWLEGNNTSRNDNFQFHAESTDSTLILGFVLQDATFAVANPGATSGNKHIFLGKIGGTTTGESRLVGNQYQSPDTAYGEIANTTSNRVTVYGEDVSRWTVGANARAVFMRHDGDTGDYLVERGGWNPIKLNGVRYADRFAGADTGAKLIACLADISTGGKCEHFASGGTISSTVVLGSSTKQVTLELGCGTYTGTANPLFRVDRGSRLILNACTTIQQTSNTANGIILAGDGYQWINGGVFGPGKILGPGSGTSGVGIIVGGTSDTGNNSAYAANQMSFQEAQVAGFGTGFKYGNNVWNFDVTKSKIGGSVAGDKNGIGIHAPSGFTNSGENLQIVNASIAGSVNEALKVEAQRSFHVVNTSFDNNGTGTANPMVKLDATNAALFCVNCHFEQTAETAPDTRNFIEATAGQVVLKGGWVQPHATHGLTGYIVSASGSSYVEIDGTFLASAATITGAVNVTSGVTNVWFRPGSFGAQYTNSVTNSGTGRVFRFFNTPGNPFNLFPPSTVHASLGTPADGALVYCSDCTIANPCASGGTGAIAKRLNGAWVCN